MEKETLQAEELQKIMETGSLEGICDIENSSENAAKAEASAPADTAKEPAPQPASDGIKDDDIVSHSTLNKA